MPVELLQEWMRSLDAFWDSYGISTVSVLAATFTGAFAAFSLQLRHTRSERRVRKQAAGVQLQFDLLRQYLLLKEHIDAFKPHMEHPERWRKLPAVYDLGPPPELDHNMLTFLVAEEAPRTLCSVLAGEHQFRAFLGMAEARGEMWGQYQTLGCEIGKKFPDLLVAAMDADAGASVMQRFDLEIGMQLTGELRVFTEKLIYMLDLAIIYNMRSKLKLIEFLGEHYPDTVYLDWYESSAHVYDSKVHKEQFEAAIARRFPNGIE